MEGDPGRGFQLPELDGISIHTLRMEGDVRPLLFVGLVAISIHTLRMEGDNDVDLTARTISVFQSTPSAWRVT